MDDGAPLHFWTVEEAGARLETVLKDAETAGPQRIERDGRHVGYVISPVDYSRLCRGPSESWVDRLWAAADGVEIEIERDKDPGRFFEFDPD